MPGMAGPELVTGYWGERGTRMPTAQGEALRTITAAEQAAMERIVGAGCERVDRVRRATAVLAVSQGRPFIHAAQLAGLRSGTTVADLVKRFNRRGITALDVGGWPWTQTDVRSQRSCADGGDCPAFTQPTGGRDRDVVTEHPTLQRKLRRGG